MRNVVNFPANDSRPPDVYAVQSSSFERLTCDITDSLLAEMRARNNALAKTNMAADQIIAANIRAFGRLFLATIATLPEKQRGQILEEFDVLTIEYLNRRYI